jgi:hypothetical protein
VNAIAPAVRGHAGSSFVEARAEQPRLAVRIGQREHPDIQRAAFRPFRKQQPAKKRISTTRHFRASTVSSASSASFKARKSVDGAAPAISTSSIATCSTPAGLPLLTAFRACGVDQNPPHEARSHREEMRPVMPLHLLDVDQSKVGLVDEGGGLKRVTGSLPAHVLSRQPSQFGMHKRNQRSNAAVSPRLQACSSAVGLIAGL